MGFHDLNDVAKMTIAEYELRMEAYHIKRVEEFEIVHLQAWMNQQVQATTGQKNPKPKYKDFKKFFDKEKFIKEDKPRKVSDRTSEIAKQIAENKKKGGN